MRSSTLPSLASGAVLLAALPLALLATRTSRPAPPAPTVAKRAAPTGSPVVDAANDFMATLDEGQKAKLMTDMNQATVQKWSNLPVSPGSRNGLQFGAMNEKQTAAALKLARLALGEEGFARMQEIRAADDLLTKGGPGGRGPGGPGGGGPPGGFGGPPGGGGFGGPPDGQGGGFGGPPGGGGFGGPPGGGQGGFGGPPGGRGGQGRGPGGPGGGMGYGKGTYSVAFLNKPSATDAWMLQIGGHHLAFNIYYKGETVASTPHFLGVEPTTWKDDKGKEHEPLKPMRDSMYGLVNSLTTEQKAQAHLDQRFSDVYLGPRRNGRFPTDIVGVPVTSLSAKSQALVRQSIEAWTGDVAQAAAYRKLYFSELDKTKVAYSGDTDFEHQGDYVRIDGPHVWIEFACQDGIVYRKIHYHTVWRDRKTDYGVSYAF